MPAQCPSQFILRRPLLGVAVCCILGIVGGVFISSFAPGTLFLATVSALMVSLVGNWAARRSAQRGINLPSVPHGQSFSSPPPVLRSALAKEGPSSHRRPSAMVGRLSSALSLLSLHLAILLTAWLAVALNLHNPSGRELAALMDQPREGVELSGVITDDPFVQVARNGTNRVWSFPLRVETIRRLPSWQTAHGTVQVRLRDRPGSRPPQYGERWRMSGMLVDNARFPEARPVLEWIKNRYSFTADPTTGMCLAEGQGTRLMSWCFQGRRKAADCLALGIDHRPEVVGLLQALLLGYRQELPDKLRRDFIATGTYHIIAISGQHVAILALFIIVVLQTQRVCRVKWFLYVAPVLIVFTLATGLSSSAVRGCLMALLVFLGPLLHRKPDLPSAMAMAAILILAVDPFQLFDYGFLLSFGAVAGLIVFCPPMLKAVEPSLESDPWRLEPERFSVQFGRNVIRFFALLLVSSLAAWLVSTPLIARWFNLVSPVALLANLVVIPVSTFVLLAGCLSILFGTWLPWLGEVFNFANVALVSFLLFITDGMARIPWGHFFVASPPIWAILVWFGTLVAWLPALRLRRLWLAGPVLLAVAFLGSVILNWSRVSADITNVGDIPVCLIKTPGMAHMLVHAGSRFAGRRVVQKLQQQGVNRLSALVLPAADDHHAGGALDVLASFRVKELWCATTNSRSPVFREVLVAARERSIPIRVFTNDTWSIWRGGMDWQYQAVANEFLVRRGETVLKIGWGRHLDWGRQLDWGRHLDWGRAMPGQDAPDMVTVARHNSDGMPATWRIRCIEPGEVVPENNGADGITWVGLAPGQTVRVDLKETKPLIGVKRGAMLPYVVGRLFDLSTYGVTEFDHTARNETSSVGCER